MANRRSPDAPKSAHPVPAAVEATPVKRPPRPPTAPPTAPPKAPVNAPVPTRVRVTPEARRALIAENAYLRAERRGFQPGYETEDWLGAEAEVDVLLKAAQGSPQ
jgi:Protein of unknown function (DUF2934)